MIDVPAGPGDPRWHHHAVCGSTNDEAARLGRAGAPEGTVVTAAAQERGRGRLGRTWYSPPGENLYLSLLLRPEIPPPRAPFLTLCAGVGAAEAVAEAAGPAVRVELKWPNDVLASGPGGAGKVAGVLTEMVTCGARLDFVVIGVGVNLHTRAFPDELAGKATSLGLCAGLPAGSPSPLDFAGRLVAHIGAWCDTYLDAGPGPVRERFLQRAAFLGPRDQDPGAATLTVRSGATVVSGQPLGLSEDGALLLVDAAGTVHTVLAGEIAL